MADIEEDSGSGEGGQVTPKDPQYPHKPVYCPCMLVEINFTLKVSILMSLSLVHVFMKMRHPYYWTDTYNLQFCLILSLHPSPGLLPILFQFQAMQALVMEELPSTLPRIGRRYPIQALNCLEKYILNNWSLTRLICFRSGCCGRHQVDWWCYCYWW